MRVGKGPGVCARCLLAAALPHPPDAEADSLPAAGQLIGSYRILRPLGEGGMGVVYLAEQEHPIARQVALKFIKLGMDTRAVLARFQSEQQVLALMDHPNIAQVHEAGSDPRGRPYFVMEYVPGVPLTDYCDLKRLDSRQRLELFLKVVNAVQHAHQKGVIHRDLKPSNILVVERDCEAVPKIIDFGVAKATDKEYTEITLFTETGVMLGTPEYISPEQSFSARNVDSRTDIYSLGVLLYELLTGALPFDSRAFRTAGVDEIRRMIREEDPPRPTIRLGALGPRATAVASCRATDPGGLRRLLRGDLDWITMKAIEKDTTRRYPSASDMGNDIRRHLSDEPVIAAKPGFGYRIEKCIRANRPLISAVLAGVGAVLSFLNFLLCIGGFGGPYISRILGTPYSNIRNESRVSLRANHVAVIAATLTVILIVLLAILTFVFLAYIRVLRDRQP